MFRSIVFDVVLLLEKEITYFLFEKSISFYDIFSILVCKMPISGL